MARELEDDRRELASLLESALLPQMTTAYGLRGVIPEQHGKLVEDTHSETVSVNKPPCPGPPTILLRGLPHLSNIKHKEPPVEFAEYLSQRGDSESMMHAAWDFCGYVWFDNGEFHEQVMQWGEPAAQFAGRSLKALFQSVNNLYGWK